MFRWPARQGPAATTPPTGSALCSTTEDFRPRASDDECSDDEWALLLFLSFLFLFFFFSKLHVSTATPYRLGAVRPPPHAVGATVRAGQ